MFWLHKNIDGTTQTNRQALEIVAKRKKVHPNELFKLPDCNEKALYLIEWFYQLKKSEEPIRYSEIESWSRLTKTNPTKAEVETIMKLDLEHSIANKTK